MNVNGKAYLRSNGWVLSKILPTLVEGSRVTTVAIMHPRDDELARAPQRPPNDR
jgi:hypothetical protein